MKSNRAPRTPSSERIHFIGEVAGAARLPLALLARRAVVSSPGRTGSPAPPSRIVGVLLSGRRALALRPREADRDPDHPEQHGGGELRVAAHQPRQARRCQRSAPPQRARGAAPPATARVHPPPEGRAAPTATAREKVRFLGIFGVPATRSRGIVGQGHPVRCPLKFVLIPFWN